MQNAVLQRKFLFNVENEIPYTLLVSSETRTLPLLHLIKKQHAFTF